MLRNTPNLFGDFGVSISEQPIQDDALVPIQTIYTPGHLVHLILAREALEEFNN